MSEYLAKPVDIGQLRAAIVRLLEPNGRAELQAVAPQSPGADEGELIEAPLLDDGPLVLLRTAVEESEFRSLVRGWTDGTRQRLEQAAAAHDPKVLRKIAHDLAGTSGTFGASRLSVAARRLESTAQGTAEDLDRESLARALADLQRVGEQSIEAMGARWGSK